jgi:hypothetical protein
MKQEENSSAYFTFQNDVSCKCEICLRMKNTVNGVWEQADGEDVRYSITRNSTFFLTVCNAVLA